MSVRDCMSVSITPPWSWGPRIQTLSQAHLEGVWTGMSGVASTLGKPPYCVQVWPLGRSLKPCEGQKVRMHERPGGCHTEAGPSQPTWNHVTQETLSLSLAPQPGQLDLHLPACPATPSTGQTAHLCAASPYCLGAESFLTGPDAGSSSAHTCAGRDLPTMCLRTCAMV